MQEDEMEEARITHDELMAEIAEAEWPTREQIRVVETAANHFGSVAIDRVAGTDSMRMSTPEGDVIVNADGERVEAKGLDYAAITRVRHALKAEASRCYYGQTKGDGMAYEALTAAEGALFHALNVLAHQCDDAEAMAVLHA